MKIFNLFFLLAITALLINCKNSKTKQSLTKKEQAIYLEKGKTVAQQSFKVLSSALKKSMSENGLEEAVAYCNTKAFPLVDSLSNIFKATIKRTSLKVRNPLDKPSKNELKMLNYYQQQHNNGQKIVPKVTLLENGKVAFYSPIKIKSPLCLACHGKVGETLNAEKHQKIKELYPEDKAIDYSLNDLRGMWSIVFEKE